MNPDCVMLKDVNGMKVFVSHLEISRSITEVFGMSLPVVAELRLQYLKRNGPADMTPETVRETFGHDKPPQKPPLGIMPAALWMSIGREGMDSQTWLQKRVNDLRSAIYRSIHAGVPVPKEWWTEFIYLTE